MGQLELKQQFLDKLKQLKKAMDYMDSPTSMADKEKWQPRFCKILAEVNGLHLKLKLSGCEMSDEEIHRLIENM